MRKRNHIVGPALLRCLRFTFYALFTLTPFLLSAAPLLSTNLPPISPTLPDASFSVIRVFGALVLVLGLFLGGVWIFKNWQRVALHRGRPSQLQVVEMKSLGGKHALYVVGYQQQRLLLACSPSGVSLVSHLPAEDSAPVTSQAVGGDTFMQALQNAVQAKAG
jgi:flagellar biogenesis protein FliO